MIGYVVDCLNGYCVWVHWIWNVFAIMNMFFLVTINIIQMSLMLNEAVCNSKMGIFRYIHIRKCCSNASLMRKSLRKWQFRERNKTLQNGCVCVCVCTFFFIWMRCMNFIIRLQCIETMTIKLSVVDRLSW